MRATFFAVRRMAGCGPLLFLIGTAMTTMLFADDADPLLETFVEELVPIEPGRGRFPAEFRMGLGTAESPHRTVKLSAPFRIAKYEVPQNLYEAVMGENPSRWKGPRNSAEMMTFAEAEQFCQKLTERLRRAKLIGDDDVVRLPTEAEWEYCCRAGTTTAYSFGDEPQQPGDEGAIARRLDSYAWHTGNAAGNDPPVGALKPNPWGLYDMHGYLWEFTSTPWDADDESGPVVIKGGSWRDRYDDLRCGVRKPIPRDAKGDAVGIRCIVSRTSDTPAP